MNRTLHGTDQPFCAYLFIKTFSLLRIMNENLFIVVGMVSYLYAYAYYTNEKIPLLTNVESIVIHARRVEVPDSYQMMNIIFT